MRPGKEIERPVTYTVYIYKKNKKQTKSSFPREYNLNWVVKNNMFPRSDRTVADSIVIRIKQ